MGRRKKAESEPEEQPSRAAGACVLVVLASVALAAVFAVSPTAGVLLLWVVGGAALWRCARSVSDSSATPPPEEARPSCRECAGHELVSVTPLAGQKGMWIYTTAAPDRPNHTHVHVVAEEVNTP
ncbi:hypothetical protein [Streptomyces sp. NPDC002779]|uniref:hypothetical protein n=1 Tax=Streptomyces sp. NPDC002779 TaxID=3364664 RepID=UPI00368E0686